MHTHEFKKKRVEKKASYLQWIVAAGVSHALQTLHSVVQQHEVNWQVLLSIVATCGNCGGQGQLMGGLFVWLLFI